MFVLFDFFAAEIVLIAFIRDNYNFDDICYVSYSNKPDFPIIVSNISDKLIKFISLG